MEEHEQGAESSGNDRVINQTRASPMADGTGLEPGSSDSRVYT